MDRDICTDAVGTGKWMLWLLPAAERQGLLATSKEVHGYQSLKTKLRAPEKTPQKLSTEVPTQKATGRLPRR